LPPTRAPLARSSGAWPFRDSWWVGSPFRSALLCLPGLSRLCRRPSHPFPGFFTDSAEFSLRSPLHARRPFRGRASSPHVRGVNAPAQPLALRCLPWVARASRTSARSPCDGFAFARGRYDRLPQSTSTSYPRPCWAHAVKVPPGSSGRDLHQASDDTPLLASVTRGSRAFFELGDPSRMRAPEDMCRLETAITNPVSGSWRFPPEQPGSAWTG
jgi:hypothetical protein